MSTPMQIANAKLLAYKKEFRDKMVELVLHTQQLGKKVGPFGYAII
jgi:hypothetical protein